MTQPVADNFDPPQTGLPSPSGVIPAKVPTLPGGRVNIDTSKPIPFDSHVFGAVSYSTYGCHVNYAGLSVLNESNE